MRRDNRTANFRTDARLLTAAKAEAARRGISFSAMIRAALAREAGIAA